MEIFKERTKKRMEAGDNDDMYIFQFMYIHQQKNRGNRTPQQIFPQFLRDIAAVYPGYGKQGLRPLSYSSNEQIEVSDQLK